MQYAGGNLNRYSIPVLRNPKPKEVKEVTDEKKPIRAYNKSNNLLEFDYDIVDTFKSVLHDLNNPVSIYKMTTIAEIREILGLANKTKWTRDRIIASAMGINVEEEDEIEV